MLAYTAIYDHGGDPWRSTVVAATISEAEYKARALLVTLNREAIERGEHSWGLVDVVPN